MLMKDKSNDDEIKVNRRSTDKIYFESTLIQQISDGIDFLRDESKEILKELDSNIGEEFDLEEFSENAFNHIDDFVDDLSEIRSEIINSDDFNDVVKESSRNAKRALNRDADYIRRAKRKLNRLDLDEDSLDFYKANIRVIELCEKASYINKSNAEAYYIKGLALANLKRYDEAIEEYINSLRFDDGIDVWLAIANANRLNGDLSDAIDVYDKVLSMEEDSFEAIKGKAYTYYDWEKYLESANLFKRANSIEILDDESKEKWDICLEKLEEDKTFLFSLSFFANVTAKKVSIDLD